MSSGTKRLAETALQPLPDAMALPNAAILRIIKSKLPEGVQLHKDAKTAFSKACSLFVLYLTTMAQDVSREAKRATVSSQDVIKGLKELEFDDLVEQIEICIVAFREADKARVLAARAKKAKLSGDAAGGAAEEGGEEEEEEVAEEEGAEEEGAGGEEEADAEGE